MMGSRCPVAAVVRVAAAVLLAPCSRAESESPGVYFGTFDRNGGLWAMDVDREWGHYFVGFIPGQRLIVGYPYFFDVVPAEAGTPEAPASAFWDSAGYSGLIATDGRVTGTSGGAYTTPVVNGRSLPIPPTFSDSTFSGALDRTTGEASPFEGSWEGRDTAANAVSRAAWAFVGPSGRAVLFTRGDAIGGDDAGMGIVSGDGRLDVISLSGRRRSVRLDRGSTSRVPGRLFFDLPADTARPPFAPNADSRIVNFSVLQNRRRFEAAVRVSEPDVPLLIRGVGPGLQSLLPAQDVAANPQIEVHPESGRWLKANDDWEQTPAMLAATAVAGAWPLPPSSRDAVILTNSEAERMVISYQDRSPAPLTSAPEATGLVETFLAEVASRARITHFTVASTLTSTNAPDDTLNVGFVLAGTGQKHLLLRALGPALATASYGRPADQEGRMDPFLSLHSIDGTVLAANDNWPPELAPLMNQAGATLLVANSADAAVAVRIAPGAYFITVRGRYQATLPVAVEVFEIE